LSYKSFLSLRHDGKGIPYGGMTEPRADGSQNFGFVNLKTNPALIASVPELQKDGNLRSVVRAINDCPGLFSVGCESAVASDQRGHWRTGYVEFAINSKSHVQDACNYFRIFYLFDCELAKMPFTQSVRFDWELQPGTFMDQNVSGYTCTVYVNTAIFSEPSMAEQPWSAALAALAQVLSMVPTVGEPIYSPSDARLVDPHE
jgi:hypothetical protein